MPTLFGNQKTVSLNTIIATFVATIITVGAGIFVTRIIGPVPISVSQTTTQKQAGFEVTGQSQITAVPDEVQLRVGVEITQSTVVAAQENVNQITTNLIDALTKLGIDQNDIKTSQYSVFPQRDFQNPINPITAYQVNSQLLIKTTDLELLGQVIDVATSLGANQINDISFSLSDDKKDELIKAARKEAIGEAQDNAKELASLAGLKLGKIIDIRENQGNQYLLERSYDLPMTGGEGVDTPTPINPGTSELTYTITLSYETL